METSSKTKQLAMDTVLFAISTFGSKILVFLLTPLYTTVLLTEEYGVADLLNTTVNLIYPILTLAISDATLRFALDKNGAKSTVLGNSVVITVFSLLLLMGCYPVMNLIDSEITVQLSEYWWYFVAIYALYNFHLCFANFAKGIGRTKLFAIQGIAQTITVILCNIYFLLVVKNGLRGYLMSTIIGLVVPTVLILCAGGLIRYIFPLRLDRKLMGEMLKYSMPMIPTLLAWSINMYINKYMLIGLLPQEEGLSASGIFSVANKIPSLLTTVLSVFTQAWQLSAISNVNDLDESAFYTKMYGVMHIVALVAGFVIVPLSKPVSMVMFDSSYYSAWQHIPFLTMSAFFSSMCGFLASAFRAYKKTEQLFVSVAVGAGVNIFLNLILINTVGVVGVSIATAASFFVTWAVRIWMIQKLVEVRIRFLPTAITYALMITSSTLISFEVCGAYVVHLIVCLLVPVLNYADVKKVCALMGEIYDVAVKRLTRNGEA